MLARESMGAGVPEVLPLDAYEDVRRDPRIELVNAELAPDRVGERIGEAGHDLELLRLQGLRPLDDPGEGGEAATAEALARPGLKPLERLGDRLARFAVPDSLDQRRLPLGDLVPEEVFLGREVVEDGLLGDSGRGGNFGDGNVVEAASREETHRLLGDLLPGAQLLRLAEPHSSIIAPFVTVAEIFPRL